MNYALITGASKGIGKSIAEALAAKGNNLLLISRSEETLKELSLSIGQRYKVRVDYLAADLSHAGSTEVILKWLTEKNYSVDTLVNNAGYGIWGKFSDRSIESHNEMLQLNMLTLVQLTYALIPQLKKHPKSYILNVASTAAYQAVPTLSLYAASKSFVLLFTRGIRLELQSTGVSVSCLCPGPTATDFVERAGMSADIKKKSDTFSMTADEVAKIGVNGLYKGKAEIIPGLLNKIIVVLTAWLPKFVTEKIANDLYKK
ncbi:SDR family NAD(P)-dependent oxidoreductase [Cytophaga aurantiaca]|uniref:SDR family NAD(P)-dependent oxidoreductase n=1 Tax=Cytophaga aurantiaca TaxID=29530 RepID=UPI00036E133C|nr:SDR family oxidoreductase [Cytophaga aurantiaca]